MQSSWNSYLATEELRALHGEAELAVILGSGLSALASGTEALMQIPYARIPGFGRTSVEGHPGFVSLAGIEGTPVLLFAGRFHAYEGLGAQEVAAPVSLAASLGCRRLIVTQAAGSLTRLLRTGSWMLATDAVCSPSKFCLGLHGEPLLAGGSPVERSGAGAPLLSERLSAALRTAAKEAGCPLAEGVLCWTSGPTYETSAEGRAAAFMGGDAVTMSTLAELVAARRLSLECASMSWITNFTASVSCEKTEHGHVVLMGAEGVRTLRAILSSLIRERRNA